MVAEHVFTHVLVDRTAWLLVRERQCDDSRMRVDFVLGLWLRWDQTSRLVWTW